MGTDVEPRLPGVLAKFGRFSGNSQECPGVVAADRAIAVLAPKKSWYPVLRVLEVRPRKFYATRHTFISVALSKGCNLKWVAGYCGTSVEMIEKSYGKFIADDGAAPLIRLLEGAKTQTFHVPSAISASSLAEVKVVPGGIEPLPGDWEKVPEVVEVADKAGDSAPQAVEDPQPETSRKGPPRGRKRKPV
jgi:hypothetical protein